MGSYKAIVGDLKSFINKEKAEFLPRFFKTGKGQYGEGDKFHGITVPNQRTVVKKHCSTTSKETIIALLDSPYHEERLTGILIMCEKFREVKKNRQGKRMGSPLFIEGRPYQQLGPCRFECTHHLRTMA